MRNRHPVTLLAAACVAGTLALGGLAPRGAACPRHYAPSDPRPTYAKVNGRFEVRLDTRYRYYRFQGSNMQLQGVYVYTRDERLAKYVRDQASNVAFWQALQATAQRFTCADVMMGKDLARVEKAMAQAVLAAYRKATRRAAAAPDVMLGLYEGYGIACNPPARPKP